MHHSLTRVRMLQPATFGYGALQCMEGKPQHGPSLFCVVHDN